MTPWKNMLCAEACHVSDNGLRDTEAPEVDLDNPDFVPNNDRRSRVIPQAWHLESKVGLKNKTSFTPNLGGNKVLNKSVIAFYILSAFLCTSLLAMKDETTCSKRLVLHTIKYNSCIPKTLLITACSGNCTGYSITNSEYSTDTPKWTNCCQAVESRNATVHLKCPRRNGRRGYFSAAVNILLPDTCMCRPCGDLRDKRC